MLQILIFFQAEIYFSAEKFCKLKENCKQGKKLSRLTNYLQNKQKFVHPRRKMTTQKQIKIQSKKRDA